LINRCSQNNFGPEIKSGQKEKQEKMKKEKIAVIGLGDMGGVLASTLLKADYEVNVWNRSPEKARVLVETGVILANDVKNAVSGSDIVIVCLTDYEAGRKLLQTDEIAAAINGKLLVELSTGTPKDARDNETWARKNNIGYIDGAILATPSQMGRPETPIFVSGTKADFERGEQVIRTLGGSVQFMGEDAGAAATWDFGFLSCMFGGMLGFFHGARIFNAEGIPADQLGALLLQIAPAIGEMIKYQGEVIRAGNYQNPESSIDTCATAMELIMRQAADSGINNEVPALITNFFKRAQKSGYGKEQLAAVYKVLE
jgi:3-hydroxyisobutyrate dehydrogenase-like beta-hydroxyacid dehydrogenase